MICRQCAVPRQGSGLETPELSEEEAMRHLVQFHGNRAEKLILSLLKLLPDEGPAGEFTERELAIYEALRDRVKEEEYEP